MAAPFRRETLAPTNASKKPNMTERQPQTRTGATKPEATRHLDTDQERALDATADAEHADGKQREDLIRKVEKLGGKREPIAD